MGNYQYTTGPRMGESESPTEKWKKHKPTWLIKKGKLDYLEGKSSIADFVLNITNNVYFKHLFPCNLNSWHINSWIQTQSCHIEANKKIKHSNNGKWYYHSIIYNNTPLNIKIVTKLNRITEHRVLKNLEFHRRRP
jgi:hypothetical protein